MPWLSRTPTPVGSPVAPAWSSPTKTNTPNVTYIPPLIDGACGTLSRSQRSMLTQLRSDLKTTWQILPSVTQATWQNTTSQWRASSWIDRIDTIFELVLSVAEVLFVLLAVPLWLCLPGILFCGWAASYASCLVGFAWMWQRSLRATKTIKCAEGSKSWMMGHEAEDERWIYVSGLGQRYVSPLCHP